MVCLACTEVLAEAGLRLTNIETKWGHPNTEEEGDIVSPIIANTKDIKSMELR